MHTALTAARSFTHSLALALSFSLSISFSLAHRFAVPSRCPDVGQRAFTLGIGKRRRQLRHAGRQTPKLFVGEYQQTCPPDRVEIIRRVSL